MAPQVRPARPRPTKILARRGRLDRLAQARAHSIMARRRWRSVPEAEDTTAVSSCHAALVPGPACFVPARSPPRTAATHPESAVPKLLDSPPRFRLTEESRYDSPPRFRLTEESR